ncbi:MAG: thioredoxin [Gemmatimonadota bacterium]|jgi:thioredoxin 1|nr:thioredoxin [Gemmatimonadota bacterium]
MGNAALAVTDATFESEILQHDGLAMVDFWAEWCGPCKMIAPTIEALATEYAGKVKVAKVDVDANSTWAQKYNVRSIPTLLFFKGGQVVDQVVGALPKPAIEAKLKAHA